MRVILWRCWREESGVYVYERATAQPRAWFVARTVTASEAETIAGINHPDFDPYETAFVTSPDVRCSGGSSSRITVEQETTNTLVARVEGAGGLAVFSEQFAPGWRPRSTGRMPHPPGRWSVARDLCARGRAYRCLRLQAIHTVPGCVCLRVSLDCGDLPQFAAYHRSSSVPRMSRLVRCGFSLRPSDSGNLL